MRTSSSLQKQLSKSYWFIPVILIVIPFMIEASFGNNLYDYSVNSIIKTQKWMLTNLMSSNEKKMYTVFEVFQMFSVNTFFIIFTGLLSNFINSYKTLVLIFTISLSNLLCSLLNFIYSSPRPFMVNIDIKPLYFYRDWGNPCTQMVTMLSFFSTLYYITFKSEATKSKLVLKIILGIFFGILCMLLTFLYFASGATSVSQLLFSLFLGAFVFFTIIAIFQPDLNNPKEFYRIVKFRLYYYCIINAILTGILILIYIFIKDSLSEDFYTTNINEQRGIRINTIEKEDQAPSFSLYEGTFCNALCFVCNFIAIVGLKVELIVCYKKNYDAWMKNNFEVNKLDGGTENNIYKDMIFFEGTQWNHTNKFKSILRFVLLIILIGICYIPAVIIGLVSKKKNNNEESEGLKAVQIIFYIVFPFYYITFGIFFLFKAIFRKISLANKIVGLSNER